MFKNLLKEGVALIYFEAWTNKWVVVKGDEEFRIDTDAFCQLREEAFNNGIRNQELRDDYIFDALKTSGK